jgi:HD-GYP domain-containing protein (c-di-GMP phosphodiesterase class II)
VLYHHERHDGRGYPHGLAGGDIPIFGRLIGLADAFDAMSSHRTYRRALKLEDVLEEIRRCAGSQFDPVLAEAFVAMDFAPFNELIARHERHLKTP